MTDLDIPSVIPAEPVPVQLTRMEGMLQLIAYKVDSLVVTVARHGEQIAALLLTTQRLEQDAESSKATVIATAKALREAKEAQEATARAESAKDDQSWTPITRMFAVLAAAGGLVAAVATFTGQ